MVSATEDVAIGAFCALGERVTVIDSDHDVDGSDAHWAHQPLRIAPVAVGPNAVVGANSVVLRGARIGANAVVAAGSIVTAGEHAGGWLIAGTPARAAKALER